MPFESLNLIYISAPDWLLHSKYLSSKICFCYCDPKCSFCPLNPQWAKKWENGAISNCCISVRWAIKLHTFGSSAEQMQGTHMPNGKGCNFIPPQALIQQFIFSTLFYCLTIEQFFIQVPSEVRHMCWKGASKIPL